VLGDLDVDGDNRADLITLTNHTSDSRVFVYNSLGQLLYTMPILQAHNGVAVSVGKMPDMNGDGRNEFLVGINDYSGLGKVLLVSGPTGAVLRQNQGLLFGDKTCDFVRSMGDLDGDGVHEYAAFPWITAFRAIVLVWSGATGQLLRTWDEFGNSVLTGEDFDRDGVPDLAIGSDWVIAPNLYGSTRVYSGRDGGELWRVDNVPFVPYGQGSNGYWGWMEYRASLGLHPNDAYPTIAWLDADWIMVGTQRGRVRAYRTNFVDQGAVRGRPCSSAADLMPLIGARRQPSAASGQNPARITVARGQPGSAAWLNLGLATQNTFAGLPLPIGLAGFGLPGCWLQVAPIASTFTVLGTTRIDLGYGFVDLPQRFAPATTGLRIAAQWLLFDPATLAYAASEVHELSLQ
jgi:hypothetical protein